MKKLVLLAAVAVFTSSMIGCGPGAPTTKATTGSTTVTTETKATTK